MWRWSRSLPRDQVGAMLTGTERGSSTNAEKDRRSTSLGGPTRLSAVTRRHLFVCTNPRASGRPACGPRGGEALLAEVQTLLVTRGAADVLVTSCGCLGPCFDGPNAVVYPDGAWYAGLAPDDAPALVRHLIEGTPFAEKASEPPGAPDQ